jgi:hypothetical protein
VLVGAVTLAAGSSSSSSPLSRKKHDDIYKEYAKKHQNLRANDSVVVRAEATLFFRRSFLGR